MHTPLWQCTHTILQTNLSNTLQGSPCYSYNQSQYLSILAVQTLEHFQMIFQMSNIGNAYFQPLYCVISIILRACFWINGHSHEETYLFHGKGFPAPKLRFG